MNECKEWETNWLTDVVYCVSCHRTPKQGHLKACVFSQYASLQAEVEEAYIRGALDYCRKESLVREDVDVPDDLLSKDGE